MCLWANINYLDEKHSFSFLFAKNWILLWKHQAQIQARLYTYLGMFGNEEAFISSFFCHFQVALAKKFNHKNGWKKFTQKYCQFAGWIQPECLLIHFLTSMCTHMKLKCEKSIRSMFSTLSEWVHCSHFALPFDWLQKLFQVLILSRFIVKYVYISNIYPPQRCFYLPHISRFRTLRRNDMLYLEEKCCCVTLVNKKSSIF